MFYRSIRSGCNYKLAIISLLSILGLLEIVTHYREDKNAQMIENVIADVSNYSFIDDYQNIVDKSPTNKMLKEERPARILLLAYAR